MKTIFLRACAFLALAASASAEIIGVDTFDYPHAAIAGQSGGTIWDFKNVAPAALLPSLRNCSYRLQNPGTEVPATLEACLRHCGLPSPAAQSA